MKFDITFDYPAAFPWLLPMAQAEYGKTLERAAAGQLAAYGRDYATDGMYGAIASGESFDSFDISEVGYHGDRMEIELAPKGDRAQVVSWIEFGRPENQTRMPSIQMAANILEWAIDKGIYSPGGNMKEANSFAWAVATIIAREGLEPRFIMERSQRRYKQHIIRMFEAASRRLAKKISARLARGDQDGI